jgi:DNA repair protein RadD
LNEIRSHFKAGHKKVLLHLATGAGKTVIFSEMLKATANNGYRAGMVVRGKQLVEQACQRLLRENVTHGVIQADHWNKNFLAPIQLCSIDTLIARRYEPINWQLMVIDEAHLATTGAYKTFIENFKGYIVAVTATPWGKNSLSHLAEKVVHPITTKGLIDLGFLKPPVYYAPSKPDLKGVGSRAGDFIADQLEQKMNPLTGDIVEHYRELGEDRPALLFAVNLEHSKMLCDRFNSAGIPAEHVEGMSTFTERAAAIENLRIGKTKILCNVGVMCTGVDIPFLSCIIMARPTKSYNLYIQQLGRGTRPFPGQENFKILDHAGNVLRHGFMTDEPEVILDGEEKERPLALRTCSVCYAVYIGVKCPYGCAPELTEEKERPTVEIAGKLVQLSEMPEALEVKQFVERCKETQKKRGYKRGWVYYQVKDKFGEKIADELFPKRNVPWFATGAR